MQNCWINKRVDRQHRLSLIWLSSIVLALIISLTGCFLSENAPMYYHVTGSSMNPGIVDGDYLTIDQTAYHEKLPERYDIVVFAHPTNPENHLVKRIIGLPGEMIEMRNGQLWINDQLINESYIREPARYTREWLLGEQEYIVLSDNRNNGSDSHSWGVLPFENIEGKAMHICKSRTIASCREINSE